VLVGAKATPLVTAVPPFHVYVLAPEAVNITVFEGQIPEEALAVFATVRLGTPLLTVMVTCAELTQLDALIAVSVYTVLVVGATTIDEVVAPLLHE
jgi:hypothetical protein